MFLKKLLVYNDFTVAANLAAQHCYQVASLCKGEVISLHVINDNEDLEWAEKKCVEQIKKIKNYDETVVFTPLATKQDLFKGMNKWLEEREISMTFMATHGKKDIQFLTGSHALKLIFNAEITTMVVQHKTHLKPYKNILLPVFSHQTGMQFPTSILCAFGSLFNASLTLLIPSTNSEQDKEEIQKTVDWLKEMLENDFLAIHVKTSVEPEKSFSKGVLATITKENIDLVAVLIGAKHHRDKSEKNKKFIQAVITNDKHLPVLCL